jgi:hypothetical protein
MKSRSGAEGPGSASFGKPGFGALLKRFFKDLPRDISRNRFRRLGQAMVLAHEWPDNGEWLHAHFIHTPASVTEYTSMLTGVPWTCSAHAKDIWTSPTGNSPRSSQAPAGP